MNDIPLPGLRPRPLAGYLQALGLLRALVRQRDADARGWWKDDVFWLSTHLTTDELARFLVDEYAPSPVVSPWNARGGFGQKGRRDEARVASLGASTAPRLDVFRRAIDAAERVADEARRRGWAGGSIWTEDHKRDVLLLCRNEFPDGALPWLDACVALTGDGQTYNRLLGDGGVFGSQDVSSTYMQRVLDVMGPKARSDRSRGWVESALFGREDTAYLRDTVGQFDPGRAGGMHSSPWEKADDTGFVNPWAQILVIEGTLLFAGAVVRRLGVLNDRTSLPFIVRSSPVGYSSGTEDETVKGELWAPIWERPASLAELERLLGEGRAEWNGRQATNGLDFVRAVASLGVDRGLAGFTRHVFVERLGQNPLAVTVDRVPVAQRREVWLLRPLDAWLTRVRRSGPLPGGVGAGLRRVDSAMYEVAAGGEGPAMRRLLVALGRLHEAVSRSGALRAKVTPYFPGGGSGEGWLERVDDGSPELRLSAGFAALRDGDVLGGGLSLRALLTPVRWSTKRLDWADTALVRHALSGPGLATALGEAHRRRAMPGVVQRSARHIEPDEPAVGVVSAYTHGLLVPLDDVQAFVSGEVDDELVADYLRGLLLLDWRGCTYRFEASALHPLSPPLALLLPFFATERVGYDDGERVWLRPEKGWVGRLLADDVQGVCVDAVRRLHIGGLRPGVTKDAVRAIHEPVDGVRLAAALLLRVPPLRARQALRATCLPPEEEHEPTTPSGSTLATIEGELS